MKESKGSGMRNSLVRSHDSVHRHGCLIVYHSGNMFIFYLAGHEVRVVRQM